MGKIREILNSVTGVLTSARSAAGRIKKRDVLNGVIGVFKPTGSAIIFFAAAAGGLKEIAVKCSIDKRVTFHLARHTFATTVTLNNNIPIETVSKMLGHSRINTTQIYAKILEKKVGEDMLLIRNI